MPALTAGDVALTIQKVQILRGSPGGQRRHLVQAVFGDSSLTYPSGGVPLPAPAGFGMVKALDYVVPVDAGNASTITWKVDNANKKLRGYSVIATNAAMTELTTGAAPAAATLVVEAVGW